MSYSSLGGKTLAHSNTFCYPITRPLLHSSLTAKRLSLTMVEIRQNVGSI